MIDPALKEHKISWRGGMFMCIYVHICGTMIVWVIYANFQMSPIDGKGHWNSDGLNIIVLIMFYAEDFHHSHHLAYLDIGEMTGLGTFQEGLTWNKQVSVWEQMQGIHWCAGKSPPRWQKSVFWASVCRWQVLRPGVLANPGSCHGASVGPVFRDWVRQVTVRGDSAQARVQGLVGAAAKCDLAPCIDHIEPSWH